ncbi:MAG: class I SAM-dependent methyltransferase [Pseudomonadota bacterium]
MSTTSRLSLALSSGDVPWPDTGRIAVFRPAQDTDLSALDRDRCHVLTGFRPAYNTFQALGFDCGTEPDRCYAAAVVFAARAKPLTLAMIAQASALTDGPVIVDGAKTDGIESVLKLCRARCEPSPALSKSHGKLFWFHGGVDLADWQLDAQTQVEGGFVTAPGVFSADGVDPGSRFLADHLPQKLGSVLADLGAGWGYLSARALAREGITILHLVEAENDALECAKLNVPDERAQFHWADATHWQPPEPLDTVVMNPPFHSGRTSDPELGRAFIRAAANALKPKGQLWLVANRHLPYEAELGAFFRDVKTHASDNRFKILWAGNPTRKGR